MIFCYLFITVGGPLTFFLHIQVAFCGELARSFMIFGILSDFIHKLFYF